MDTYGLGYIPDLPHRKTQKDARLLLAQMPSFPKSFSLESFEGPITDQGSGQNGTGSCIGHGTAQGVYTSAHAIGATLPWFPSPGGIYTPSRCIERAEMPGFDILNPPVLTDSGAMPSSAMLTISRYGIRQIQAPTPDGRFSDVTPANVNEEPNLIDLETSGQKLLVGEYRIDHTSTDFIDTLCNVVANTKAAIGIGVFVDTSFMNWDPADGPMTTINTSDPQGGGHWIAITSYDTMSTGLRVLRGANSWSRSWGDEGHFEVTENWLMQAISDCYALTVKVTS
jgi:hypothetical protein